MGFTENMEDIKSVYSREHMHISEHGVTDSVVEDSDSLVEKI